ncbi:MAG: Rieske 2Fe-2S domain-containing protein [Myxococcota bacterium]
MSRFPFGMPQGWYPVAWSDDLEVRGVLPRRYFGRDLVVYRGESGAVHGFDAFCPHLGAHLGHGGRVEGETLRCPFHAWRFDSDGSCIEVPYAKRVPPGAHVGRYPLRDQAGMLWAWYHADRAEPTWEPPIVAEYGAEGWTTTWTRYEWTVRTHPQEVVENSVDWPHFQHVHGMEMPHYRDVRFEAHEVLWEASTSKNIETLDGAVDQIHVVGRNPGLGSSYVRYSGMLDTTILMGMTPIDDETTHLRFGVLGKRRGGTEESFEAFHQKYADELARAVTQDFPVWENKAYHAKPLLSDGDGPVPEFRRWAEQFYR